MQIRDLPIRMSLAVATCCSLGACGWAGCGGNPPPMQMPGDSGGEPSSDGGTTGPAIGPLRVDTRNPRYFSNGAGAVYLTGSHTWGNFKDRAHVDPPPAFNYSAFLGFLVAHHHNFMRLWTWEQPHSFDDDPQNLLFFAQFPWPRTGPGTASDGKPRFDLDRFDPAYGSRMHDRIAQARDRGIYVAVMLFDGWDLTNAYNATDGGFPMGAGNNINSVAATGSEALTFPSAVTARQEAYVRQVIDAVNDLDNVLYEIANETGPGAVAWQNHMIDFVRTTEASKPRQHPIGMTSTYPGTDADLFASRADWISPNGRLVRGDGSKVLLNDTDHSYGWTELKADGVPAQRAWAWETLCVGAQALFMDPYLEPWSGRNNPAGGKPDAAWDPLRDALGRTRLYAERLDLERAVPSGGLCSTTYCLADPGHQYLVYQPIAGRSFTLTLVGGTYRYEWYDPAAGRVVETGEVIAIDGPHSFTPPFGGDAVLLLLP
jgi:hypothetical protein